MMRYFVACNVWLVVGFAMLVGRGPDPRTNSISDFCSIFSFGLLTPVSYWLIVSSAFLIGAAFALLHWRSTSVGTHSGRSFARGFEVIEAGARESAAT